MPDRNEYTVGWICAVLPEYVAAKAFLDEEHDPPEDLPLHDNNSYTLGQIKHHNVALAVLPGGEYGISSAAGVARDMLHSFPNIRLGLMVGIGGGAPSSKHDIRLGDIVVSCPSNSKGGVWQYDYGKTVQNQKFQTTGFLARPPTAMLTAISGLQAQYESDGHELDEAVSKILEKKPRLRRKYQRPDASTDRLYQTDFTHPLGAESCIPACNDGPLVTRKARSEDEDNPAIHYGLIASANQLMKDARIRDALSEEGVLCFEMEAAGLMNHFPCLVVRGICDYSDTHKNKEWQGYAAMIAAAYARDLLYRIPIKRVQAEKRISEILSSVADTVDKMENTLQSLEDNQTRIQVNDWLVPPDPTTNYNRALQQRHTGTGSWFLRSLEFDRWQKQQNSFLWLYGIPGCGKTILSSTIIEELIKLPLVMPLLYFYFDFNDKDKQQLDSMIRSLISQLYRRCDHTREALERLYTDCEEGGCQPSSSALCQTFLQMVQQAGEVWIVLDALDECTTRRGQPTEGLLPWIRQLLNSSQRNTHLAVTSRPEQDITSVLNNMTNEISAVRIHSDSDIQEYVRNRIQEGDGLSRWRDFPEIQSEIESMLMSKACGMFRWAACQIDALEKCLDYGTLQETLSILPETLDETYDRILQSIPREHIQSAIRILQFLTFSERPLSIEEAVDAISVNIKKYPHFDPKYRMPNPGEILYFCSSFVVRVSKPWYSAKAEFNTTSPIERYHDSEHVELQLAHYSVKEYLLSSRLSASISYVFQETTAIGTMAKVCIAYLLHFKSQPEIQLENSRHAPPFARYTAKFWMDYAAIVIDEDQELLALLDQFLRYEEQPYKICYTLHRPDRNLRIYRDKPATALYYTALGGLLPVAQMLLSRGVDVNAEGGRFANALQAASSKGYEKIVVLLLDRGSKVNAQGGRFGNALYAAASQGHLETVHILLDRGADIDALGGEKETALYAATNEGHEQIVEFLLSKGANANIKCGEHGYALQAASLGGRARLVQMLIDHNADVNAFGGQFGSALQAASFEGDVGTVNILLRNGADVNIQGGWYDNALSAASHAGHEHIVRLLLDNNADPNAPGFYCTSALMSALKNDNFRTAELLLGRGADATVCGLDWITPLCFAAKFNDIQAAKLLIEHGAMASGDHGVTNNPLSAALDRQYVEMIRLLLENGADISIVRNVWKSLLGVMGYGYIKLLFEEKGGLPTSAISGQTPLNTAAREGVVDIVKLLIETGVDLNTPDNGGWCPLNTASAYGHLEVVEILLQNGADISRCNNEGWCPLNSASLYGRFEIVKILLTKGAPVSTCNNFGWDPLITAATFGHADIARILIQHGARISTFDKMGYSPLNAASLNGRTEVVRLLIESGADVSIPNNTGRTPLYAASMNGFVETAELLIEHGANVTVPNSNGRAPLYVASSLGHVNLVELLIKHGARVSTADRFGWTSLIAASAYGHLEVARILIHNGAAVSLADNDGNWTALHAASFNGHFDIVRILLDHGADAAASNGDGRTPVDLALSNGHLETLRIFKTSRKGTCRSHCTSQSRGQETEAYMELSTCQSKGVSVIITQH